MTSNIYLSGAAQAAVSSLMATAVAAVLVRGLPLKKKGKGTALAWGLLAAPAAVPNILVGYAYSPFLLPLVHHPFWLSSTYASLVAAKIVPALVVALVLLPTALSATARHAVALSRRSPGWNRSVLARSHLPGLAVTFALGFILAFNEFEIAAILGAPSWSVSVFDAHAGGLPASASIRLALSALAIQSPVFLLGTLALRHAIRHRHGDRSPPPAGPRPATCRSAWILVASVSIATALTPLAIVAAESAGGMIPALKQFPLRREISASLYLAAAASCLALLAARWLAPRRAAALAAVVPCLAGPLLIGLATLALSQSPPIAGLRLGLLPAVVALALVTLPATLALWLLAAAARRTPAAYAARISPSQHLRWRYLATPGMAIGSLVFLWIYYDVVITSLLSPPGMTTAFERLHNLMHYGRNTALSAMVVVAFLAPILAITLAWLIARAGFLLLSSKDRRTVSSTHVPSHPSDA